MANLDSLASQFSVTRSRIVQIEAKCMAEKLPGRIQCKSRRSLRANEKACMTERVKLQFSQFKKLIEALNIASEKRDGSGVYLYQSFEELIASPEVDKVIKDFGLVFSEDDVSELQAKLKDYISRYSPHIQPRLKELLVY
jgi:hypothetical protein